jgi:hypothetical protein
MKRDMYCANKMMNEMTKVWPRKCGEEGGEIDGFRISEDLNNK